MIAFARQGSGRSHDAGRAATSAPVNTPVAPTIFVIFSISSDTRSSSFPCFPPLGQLVVASREPNGLQRECIGRRHQWNLDHFILEHQRNLGTARDNRVGAARYQRFGKAFQSGARCRALVAGLDGIDQDHDLLHLALGRQYRSHSSGFDTRLVDTCLQATICGKHPDGGCTGCAFTNGGDGLRDNADQRNPCCSDDRILEHVGGVAGNHQEVGAPRFESRRHFSECRTGILAVGENRFLAIRHVGIVIDEHTHMILVALGIRQCNDFRHEIHGCVGSHSAQYAGNFLCLGHGLEAASPQ